MSHTQPLIIGYGNPLRGDDGIGPAVAAYLQANLANSQARILVYQQLTLDLAPDFAGAKQVILIDAALQGAPAQVNRHTIQPTDHPGNLFQHHVNPSSVLQTAALLYGHPPPVMLFSITGIQFELGQGLSPAIQACIPEVARQIKIHLNATPPR